MNCCATFFQQMKCSWVALMTVLCLKKEHITEFHDNIITASYIAMQKHIPYSHKSKTKVIPGWDIEIDIAT